MDTVQFDGKDERFVLTDEQKKKAFRESIINEILEISMNMGEPERREAIERVLYTVNMKPMW